MFGLTWDGIPVLPDADGERWVWLVEPSAQYPDGRVEAGYYLPVPATAPARLGLTEPLHLAPQDSAPLTRPEVVGWRPAKDGTGHRTLRAFLESRPHPEGFGLKSKDRPRSTTSPAAQKMINAWVEDLHEEKMTLQAVVDLSGGLVSNSQVGALWRRLKGLEIPKDVPGDVVGWRPAPDGTGPQTFRDFLNKRGGLPDGFELKSASRPRSSQLAQGWINAWAKTLYGKMTYAKVIELSGDLINPVQVGALWAGLARESDTRVLEGDVPGGGGSSVPGVLTRPEVVGWRPAKDGTGPRTLRAFLESRPQPPGFGLKSKDRKRSSQMAQEWIKGWVEDLHGEKMTPAEVAKLSGDLFGRSHVSELWHRLERPEIPEDVPGDVVGWRPAPDGTGPQTFRDFLNMRGDLPAGFTLKSKDRPGSITSVVAQGWINAWAGKLHGKMPQADVAELSGGLINKSQVAVLWGAVARGAGAGVPVRVAEEAEAARARSRALSRHENEGEGEGGGVVWEGGDLAAVPVGNVFG
ncbi:hypothetical protein, partial [Amycolatopsis decaplanina]